jgi:predicted  nucleic acid-binding Zn-ribbon protein
MSVSAKDLAALVAEVEAARKLLADREAYERETARLAKQVAAAEARVVDMDRNVLVAQQNLASLEVQVAEARQRVTQQVAVVEAQGLEHRRQAEQAAAGETAKIHADVSAFRERCAGERRELEGVILQLSATRTQLTDEIATFKQRIAALG